MRRVFKYEIDVTDEQTVDAFEGWKPLDAQIQNGKLCLWAEVDDEARPARWCVFVHGTGHEVHRHAAVYVGTVQISALVFHVYTESNGDVRAPRGLS